MDIFNFLYGRKWPRGTLCHAPVVARLADAGIDAPYGLRKARTAWKAGEVLMESRRMAASLGLPETTEPDEGDPCVVRLLDGQEALALCRAGDWVGMVGPDGVPAFAKLEILASWSVGNRCPR